MSPARVPVKIRRESPDPLVWSHRERLQERGLQRLRGLDVDAEPPATRTLAFDTGAVKERRVTHPGCTLRSRVQDVDRPAHIQPLPEPAGACRPRVDAKAVRVVTSAERLDGISRYCGRCGHLGQWAPIRPPESELPVGPARDLVALLVHRSMMPATEHREV